MINRIKDILLAPKKEWAKVEEENTPQGKVFIGYVLPLSLITLVAAFIGYGLIGYSVLGVRFHSIEWGIKQAIIQWVVMVGGLYLTAFIIDLLANSFGAKKDFNKAFSLIAYAYTPMLIGGIFYVLPSVAWLASLAGVYSLVLLYIGMKPMMKVPDEKHTVYFIVSLVTMVVITVVVSLVMGAILLRGGYGAGALRVL